MKKLFFLFTALCFTLSACIPAILQPQPTSPAPSVPETDIQATVAAQVAQTVQSLPSPTLIPTNSPVVITATSAPTQTQPPPTSTVTPNPTQPTLTLTVTRSTGTGAITVTVGTAGTLPSTATLNPGITVTPTGTSHYQYYGTMPPNLPSGSIALYNKSKADAYISLQCTTVDGYVTVIEYPVGGSAVGAKVPAGDYIYVAWVGGKKFTGSFRLGKLQDRRIYMYKDRVEIK
ncbi:hypothetical protein ANAEL_03265 [Anaerolineales bacterium]|nr:hypothetical protein ANAEL_03265 [Anaerolineales bacterium]